MVVSSGSWIAVAGPKFCSIAVAIRHQWFNAVRVVNQARRPSSEIDPHKLDIVGFENRSMSPCFFYSPPAAAHSRTILLVIPIFPKQRSPARSCSAMSAMTCEDTRRHYFYSTETVTRYSDAGELLYACFRARNAQHVVFSCIFFRGSGGGQQNGPLAADSSRVSDARWPNNPSRLSCSTAPRHRSPDR
jgi:hypothetical protein